MQTGAYENTHWVFDHMESGEYHGRAPHVKVVNVRVFQVPIDV
jgi:hypothetical protein